MPRPESWNQHLITIGSTEVTVGIALSVAVVVIVTLVLAWLAKRITMRHFEHHAGTGLGRGSASRSVPATSTLISSRFSTDIVGESQHVPDHLEIEGHHDLELVGRPRAAVLVLSQSP